MTGDQARQAWLAWLAQERRASAHTLEAYGHDAAEFLGFLTRHLGGEPDLAALGALRPADLRIGDPMFVDPEHRDFHLRPGSPLIDAAANLGYGMDSDAAHVPQGAGPDIGAFEFVNTADLSGLLLPLVEPDPVSGLLYRAK